MTQGASQREIVRETGKITLNRGEPDDFIVRLVTTDILLIRYLMNKFERQLICRDDCDCCGNDGDDGSGPDYD